MFAFEIWGDFACFRDPLGISQNVTLAFPPKSTICGMLASILGIDDYFDNEKFEKLQYSVIILNVIRKKSFSQNYINDYTSKFQTNINNLKKMDFDNISKGFRDKKNPQKPINRELLISPKYLIFIKDFDLEIEVVNNLKNRISKYPFYLGNSEFARNFRYIDIENYKSKQCKEVNIDSFLEEKYAQNIIFNNGVQYSSTNFSTMLNSSRASKQTIGVIHANKPMQVKDIDIYEISCHEKTYNCRFI